MDIGAFRGRHTAQQTTSILIPVVANVRAHAHAPGWFSPPKANQNVLHAFVQNSQPWSRQAVRLPRRLRWALWTLMPVELAWGIWLMTVLSGGTACDGPICAVAMLGNHAAVLLACALVCFGGLIGLVPFTRGFSQCNGRQVAGVAVASVAGVAALLGIAALIIGAAIGLIVLAVIVVIVTSAFGLAFAETS
jgi:hypothetical protein